jgi:hypothetical protein
MFIFHGIRYHLNKDNLKWWTLMNLVVERRNCVWISCRPHDVTSHRNVTIIVQVVITSQSLMVIRLLWKAGNFLQRWLTGSYSIITLFSLYYHSAACSFMLFYVTLHWTIFLFWVWGVYASNFGLQTDKLFGESSCSVSVHPGKKQDCLFKIRWSQFPSSCSRSLHINLPPSFHM